MKKFSLIIIMLIACNSCTKVHYAFKHPVASMAVAEMRSSSFGIIIIGEAISGITDIIRDDIANYQGGEPAITVMDITDIQVSRLKNDNFDEIDRNKYKARFILIVIQGVPEIKRNHHIRREGVEYTDKYMKKRKEDKDREIYSTTISVKCNILLYDNKKRCLLAKSIETFSQNSEKEISDWFHNHTLLGFAEDFFKMAEKNIDEGYPKMNQLDGYTIKGYFISFLKGIEK